MARKWICLAVIIFLAAAAAPAAKDEANAAGKRWWSDVKHLASDKLQGRATGSAGYMKAAQYVAKKFASDDLKPICTQRNFQTEQFESRQNDETYSTLTLIQHGKTVPMKLADNAMLRPAGDPPPQIET